MSRVFTGEGNHVAVTVLRVDNCQVVAQRTHDKRRLQPRWQLGVGTAKVKKRDSGRSAGHFAKAKVEAEGEAPPSSGVSEDAPSSRSAREDHRGAFSLTTRPITLDVTGQPASARASPAAA